MIKYYALSHAVKPLSLLTYLWKPFNIVAETFFKKDTRLQD